MKILLSVKPEYVYRILDKSKRFEFRHKLAKETVDSIVLYATYPVMKVVGEVKVTGTITTSPTALWERTKSFAGISREKYRKYFKSRKTASAYILGDITQYDNPLTLESIGIKKAPQSFIYLDD